VSLCAAILLCGASASAHPPEEDPDHDFEISFGQSKLFDIPPLDVGTRDSIPTNSVVFIYEHFLPHDFHVVAAFNLPLSTFKTIDDSGTLQERFAAPSFALGFSWSGLGFELKEDVRVEAQLGLLAGVVVATDGRFFPLGSIRVAIRRRDGFGLYVGVIGAFHVDTTGLIYGVAHRF
jgi:hypothetical protein